MIEEIVKLVVVAPLLDLAGFYRSPYQIESEYPIQLEIPDEDGGIIRPIHKFVSQAVQRYQRISLRLFQSKRIFFERRNKGLSIVPISNCLKVVETGLKIISLF